MSAIIKLKLNNHCKELFLRHAIQSLHDKDQEQLGLEAFYRFLVISKAYLQTTRRYYIYTFVLCNHHKEKMFSYDIRNTVGFYSCKHLTYKTYTETKQMLTLLKPKFVKLVLTGKDHSSDYVKEVCQFFEGLDCKIELELNCHSGVFNNFDLVNALGSKVYALEKNIPHYSNRELTSICLYIWEDQCSDQLIDDAKRHKVENMFPIFDECGALKNLLRNQTNMLNSVQSLRVWTFSDYEDDGEQSILCTNEFVPFLKDIHVQVKNLEISFHDLIVYEEPITSLINKFRNSYQKALELKESCRELASQKLFVCVQLELNSGEYPHPEENWIELLMSTSLFKDATFKENPNETYFNWRIQDDSLEIDLEFMISYYYW
ncbi:hypothetical protein M3Y97_00658100 [Aphelenchoides bicaudatus]|nr:hypothetical protein M3Y97_00658100 [Aphelenchoides bicaudatus]